MAMKATTNCPKCMAPCIQALVEPNSQMILFDEQAERVWRIYQITHEHRAAVAHDAHTPHVCKKGESNEQR